MFTEEEIWKDIPEYEGMYQVSNLGNAKSLNYCQTGKEKLLKPYYDKGGYLQITLSKGGTTKKFKMHRLVASLFIPNPDNKSCVDHINTIRTDNRVENLRWATHKENSNNPLTLKHTSKSAIESSKKLWEKPNDELRKKLSESTKKHWENPILRKKMRERIKEGCAKRKKPIAQLNKDYSFVRYWDSAIDAARELGYCQAYITACCRGKHTSCYGYIWQYKEYYDFRELIRLGMDTKEGVA